jgi:CheY-like chemotaxis protein
MSDLCIRDFLCFTMPASNKITRILLADDDEDDCILFQDVLNDLKQFQLSIARNGIQAMQILFEQLSSLPDIIFLDLNMPLKNGFDCLQK